MTSSYSHGASDNRAPVSLKLSSGKTATPSVIVGDAPSSALPSLMSIKDVCAQFNRSSRTIRSWCCKGKLSPIRVGGAVFFRSTDIERMILGSALDQ